MKGINTTLSSLLLMMISHTHPMFVILKEIMTSAPKGSGQVGFEGVSGPDPKLKIKPA